MKAECLRFASRLQSPTEYILPEKEGILHLLMKYIFFLVSVYLKLPLKYIACNGADSFVSDKIINLPANAVRCIGGSNWL